MNAYTLPTSLEIGGELFPIRSDYRAVLDILAAFQDPDLDSQEKASVMIGILYPDWRRIPRDRITEAYTKAMEFIDCGAGEDDKKPKPRLMDWEQDASMIIPAINSVAHTEIRNLEYLHWWTFLGYYMEIGEGLFSNVVSIRQKKAKHKKLEKYEQDFYRDNKELVDLKPRLSKEAQEEKDEILSWLKAREEVKE